MRNSKPKILKGIKAFNNDMTCRGVKFETGKTYTTEDAKCCEKGFHFCLNPLDLFNYYSPSNSKFAEVEGTGKIDTHDKDSKIACTEIKIGAEVNLNTVIDMGVKFILSKIKWSKGKKATNTGDQSAATNTGYRSAATNTGYQSAATNTGDQSAATNTGDQSAATNTGYRSAAVVEGRQSIACGLGIENKAKGKISCWLVLTEWHQVDKGWQIKDCQAKLVDGKEIKEDVWYMLKDGKFVEVAE